MSLFAFFWCSYRMASYTLFFVISYWIGVGTLYVATLRTVEMSTKSTTKYVCSLKVLCNVNSTYYNGTVKFGLTVI
jgi:hypothetical protein